MWSISKLIHDFSIPHFISKEGLCTSYQGFYSKSVLLTDGSHQDHVSTGMRSQASHPGVKEQGCEIHTCLQFPHINLSNLTSSSFSLLQPPWTPSLEGPFCISVKTLFMCQHTISPRKSFRLPSLRITAAFLNASAVSP